jgi:hypothetical protein
VLGMAEHGLREAQTDESYVLISSEQLHLLVYFQEADNRKKL